MKIIVTGASMGIGEGIATRLAEHGHDLGLIARSEDRLARLAARLRKHGGRCEIAPCDLRRADATKSAIQGLVASLGGIDGLINNAGLVIRKDVWTLKDDEWHAMLDTNLSGLWYATRAALPAMREQGRGHVINISSISGRVPLPGGSAYAATKYGVTGLSESLFQEVRDHGIKVTVVFPGSVDSASHRHDDKADSSWKLRPEEVGQACHELLCTAPGACVSLYEIRPLNRPPSK